MARLGLAEHFACVFANDIDAKKCATYRANFGGDHLREADITQISAQSIPTADLAWASFPCQDLSLAGKRGGMSSERSGTFWAFWRLMEELKVQRRAPRLIVIENVTGLLTSNDGADFEALILALGKGGYKVGGVILDAADFVPQSRPRLFLVAWDKALSGLQHRTTEQPAGMVSRAVDRLSAAARRSWCPVDLPIPPRRNIDLASVINPPPSTGVWRSEQDLEKLLGQMSPLHRARVDAAIAETDLRVGAVYRRIRKGVQRAEVRYDGMAGCIRTLKGGSSRQLLLISQNGWLGFRPMLAREAAELMGLRASYLLPNSATAAISLCGDGVCVPAVAWLSEHVLAPLLQQNLAIGPRGKRIDVN